jgi:hypothetical protein
MTRGVRFDMANTHEHTAGRRGALRLAAALLSLTLAGCATTEPTAPAPTLVEGQVNGADLSLPGGAGLLLTAGAPDTLVISGFGMDVGMFLRFAYAGPGTYALGPESVELMSLVGGDVRTGGYRGSPSIDGEIVVTQPGGTGSPILAAFWFDAVHESGEQAFGSVAEFRAGRLTARLSSMTR